MADILKWFGESLQLCDPQKGPCQVRSLGTNEAGVGLSLLPRNGKIQVEAVMKGGAAAAQGSVRPGDYLVAVDNLRLSGISIASLPPRLKGPEGSHVRLTLNRGGREYNITVKRRRSPPAGSKSPSTALSPAPSPLRHITIASGAKSQSPLRKSAPRPPTW